MHASLPNLHHRSPPSELKAIGLIVPPQSLTGGTDGCPTPTAKSLIGLALPNLFVPSTKSSATDSHPARSSNEPLRHLSKQLYKSK
jgi:hypothetical protein